MAKPVHWDRAKELLADTRRSKLRAMSEEEGVRAFCSLLAFSYEMRSDDEGWQRLMKLRWEQKLERRKLLLSKLNVDLTSHTP